MMKSSVPRSLAVAAILCSVLPSASLRSASAPSPPVVASGVDAGLVGVEERFRDPPAEARPRVWWHWMNGNVTRDGIAADLAWMKRVGIGGMQTFDVDLSTPLVVENRLSYMSNGWKEAFRFAASEADRLGLELTIASSPGWSETGGPWVAPADGLKKLVWSESIVVGGRRVHASIPAPPAVAGPYQAIPMQPGIADLIEARPMTAGPEFYRDVAVLAVPANDAAAALPRPALSDNAGKRIGKVRVAKDGTVSGATLGSVLSGPAPELRLDYGCPITVRAVTLHIPGGAVPLLGPFLDPRVEASDDGKTWRPVVVVPLEEPPTTVSFRAVTARHFRVVVRPFQKEAGEGASPGPDPNLAMEDAFGRVIGGLLARPVMIGTLQLHGEARIDRAELKAGFALAPDYLALPHVSDGALGADTASVIDLTERMGADGTLDWNAPKGRWRILRLGYSLTGKTNHPAPREATGLEVDKYDANAVERYLERYLGNYRDAAGSALVGQHGVRALLNDSIEIGAANWTPAIVAHFKRLRGYDPTPWLPALTGLLLESRERTDAFLFDFRRTLSELMASEHYGTIARFAQRNELRVYGEGIEGKRSSFGDDMAMRRHADYPMAAMWMFDAGRGPAPSYVIDIKGAASVAHLYGGKLVAAESLTVGMSPWAFGPADLKHVIDLAFALGVNRPVIHTSVHVPVEDRKPGLSLGGIGQFFNRNESWAELAAPWVQYLARNSFLLQQGRNVADVAYFYGDEAPLAGLYGERLVADVPQGYAYDFVNSDALVDALSTQGGELVSVGGAHYRVLYLGGSSRRMTLGTLRRIHALVTEGATVVGLRPDRSPSLADDPEQYRRLVAQLWSGARQTRFGKGLMIASDSVGAVLAASGVRPDFTSGSDAVDVQLPFVHRRAEGWDSYFIVNRSGRPQVFDARFRVIGREVELWRAETGTIVPAGFHIHADHTSVPMELAAGESIHVVFRNPASVPERIIPVRRAVDLGGITAPWTVTFEQGRGVTAPITLGALAPLNEHPDPQVKHFSGIATYTTAFEIQQALREGESLVLDLGLAREVAEVSVNGRLAGHAWTAPYTIDITDAVRVGPNTLQVRVANLWVNRLIRDADPAVSGKVSWSSVPTYRPTAPLRPSGLIGPVTLKRFGP